MSHKLPRTLQAVPNTLHARLEIADAMHKLFPTELRKAGFNPDEPRVPAGNPQGSGQQTAGTDHGSTHCWIGFGTPAIRNGRRHGTSKTWWRTIRERR